VYFDVISTVILSNEYIVLIAQYYCRNDIKFCIALASSVISSQSVKLHVRDGRTDGRTEYN